MNEIKEYENYKDRIIIADATPLVHLCRIGKIDYLRRLFSNIYSTETVKNEFLKYLTKDQFPNWINIEQPTKNMINIHIHKRTDDGERSAIALALFKEAEEEKRGGNKKSALILDDKNARIYLKEKNINNIDTIGTLKILNFAFEQKYFSFNDIQVIFDDLTVNKSNFRAKKSDINIIYNGDYLKIKKGKKI